VPLQLHWSCSAAAAAAATEYGTVPRKLPRLSAGRCISLRYSLQRGKVPFFKHSHSTFSCALAQQRQKQPKQQSSTRRAVNSPDPAVHTMLGTRCLAYRAHCRPYMSRTSMAAAPQLAPRRLQRAILRTVPSALWDDSMTLADLKKQLDQAIEDEDYDLAARLRDTLQCVRVWAATWRERRRCCCCFLKHAHLSTTLDSTHRRSHFTNRHKQSDARLAIEDANKRFYDAFGSGRIDVRFCTWGGGWVARLMGCIALVATACRLWLSCYFGRSPQPAATNPRKCQRCGARGSTSRPSTRVLT